MNNAITTGIVPFRRIHGPTSRISENELNGLLLQYYEFYKPIEQEYKTAAQEEYRDVFMDLIKTEGRKTDNIHIRNLKSKGYSAPPMEWPEIEEEEDDDEEEEEEDEEKEEGNGKREEKEKKEDPNEPCDCGSVSKVLSPNGHTMFAPQKHTVSTCVHLEDVPLKEMPKISYFLHIERTIETEDQEQLTHLPFNENPIPIEVKRQIYEKFPGGIHGVVKQKLESNRQIVYRMLRKCLKHHKANKIPQNPDMIYYAMYRMFPQSGTQMEYSKMFQELSKCFAEPGFDSWKLEPWKTKPELKIAANIRNAECYDCMFYMCAVHGVRLEVPEQFKSGNFCKVLVPLPPRIKIEDDCPNPPCWRTTPIGHVLRQVAPTDEELEEGGVVGYLNKHLMVQMDPNNRCSLLTFLESIGDQTFCEYAAIFIDSDSDDPESLKSCAEAYTHVLEHVDFPDESTRNRGISKHQKSYSERLRVWTHMKRRQAKESAQKRQAELEAQARREGRRLSDLMEEEEDVPVTNRSAVPFQIVEPFRPCHHPGPCSTAEDCVCKANGTCFHACQCSDDCPQRFPGCDCMPGRCDRNNCQCWLAQWECSPLTCKKCACGDVDSLYGQSDSCKNYAMTRMVSKPVEVRTSKIPGAGNGLFLLENALKNDLIIEYVGEKISDKECERRGVIVDFKKCSYIFNLLGGGGIDAEKIGNASRFANHNDRNPNICARNVIVNGEARIGLYAKKDITAGEELTFDYNYSTKHREEYFGSSKKGKR